MDVFLSVLLGNILLSMVIPTAALLNLTSFPSTATEGEPFTLMCSSNSSIGSKSLAWLMDGSQLFTTNMDGLTVSSPYTYYNLLHLEGRLTVNATFHQHNVTIKISTHSDVGTRWKCIYNFKKTTSNGITIETASEQSSTKTTDTVDKQYSKGTGHNITTTVTGDMITLKAASPALTTPEGAKEKDNENATPKQDNSDKKSTVITYIVAGSVGGAAAIVILVIIIIIILWCRRKRHHETTEMDGDYTTSHVPKTSLSGCDNEDILVMEDNVLYSTSPDVSSEDGRSVRNEAPQHSAQTAGMNLEDLYAKPCKRSKQEGTTVEYAEVKKVRKDICSLIPDGTNIEDMYAKPNKKGLSKQK